jgi:hypothetical protein
MPSLIEGLFEEASKLIIGFLGQLWLLCHGSCARRRLHSRLGFSHSRDGAPTERL